MDHGRVVYWHLSDSSDAPIRSHLRNVYASVASASLLAAVGSMAHMHGKLIKLLQELFN